MTWIKVVPLEQADEPLRRSYESLNALWPPEYQLGVTTLERPDGSSDSVTSAHSLIPEAMRHAMSTYAALLNPDLPLTRRQHEMIASVVSVQNRCFY